MFMSIVVIGCVFVDIKGYPSRTYIPGGRNAGKVRYVHGGVSRNIAEDLGNLGLDPVLLSLVDPTGTGEDVLLRLREHGVDTRLIRKVPDGMGTWLAVFDNNNDVCASISHRPDLSPLLSLLQAEGNTLFSGADSILLELDLDEPLMEEISKQIQQKSLCRCIEYQYCAGSAGLPSSDRLLCMQPSGGRCPVLCGIQRRKPGRPGFAAFRTCH